MNSMLLLFILSPYLLLFAAIAAVWLPAFKVAGFKHEWRLAYVLALCAGLAALAGRLLNLPAVMALLILALLLFFCTKDDLRFYLRLCCGMLAAILALALAMHKIPGFQNPLLLDKVSFSPDSLPFSLYANFDKGMVGFLLLSLFCRRAGSLNEFFSDGKRIAIAAVLSITVLLALGLGLQFFRFDPKLPQATLSFLSVNLFLTCVAEEAFFRGFIQECCYRLSSKAYIPYLAVSTSALLFGLAHLGGGVLYAGLATVAGVAYAYVYHVNRRIEWAILTHFTFNLCHFIFFSYPRLA